MYTSAIIDWLAVWDVSVDRCFYIPAAELGPGMSTVSLRLAPCRNSQVRRVRLAGQYASI
jgi:hypothetical protein